MHVHYYANMPMQYTAIFHSCKNGIFFLFLLKTLIVTGYTLEPPHPDGSNEYPQSKFSVIP